MGQGLCGERWEEEGFSLRTAQGPGLRPWNMLPAVPYLILSDLDFESRDTGKLSGRCIRGLYQESIHVDAYAR